MSGQSRRLLRPPPLSDFLRIFVRIRARLVSMERRLNPLALDRTRNTNPFIPAFSAPGVVPFLHPAEIQSGWRRAALLHPPTPDAPRRVPFLLAERSATCFFLAERELLSVFVDRCGWCRMGPWRSGRAYSRVCGAATAKGSEHVRVMRRQVPHRESGLLP